MIQLDASILSSLFLSVFPFIFLYFFLINHNTNNRSSSESTTIFPKSYPLIGPYFALSKNRHRFVQWTSDLLRNSPNSTFLLIRPFYGSNILTSNPSNVRHILKTRFDVYGKGDIVRTTLQDLLGDGIFNTDGEKWKFQRQISSHEFNARSLRKFVETVVDDELSDRLIPIFVAAAADNTVLDLQDILQRFAFDNICKIAFGYDPAYLLPSLPQAKFAVAFEEAVRLSTERFASFVPLFWKIRRFFGIGSERNLKLAVTEIREFAGKIIREKKDELREKSSLDSADLLSRFLGTGHSDEDFVTDIVVSFILAGRDTTSAVLTWFFWLISRNGDVENEILREIGEMSEAPMYDEVKHMAYTHASLCETMRLYPPVPVDGKQASSDDVLPDGTLVRKGMRVSYHPYAMGREEKLWGQDWEEFRPGRWLEKDDEGKEKFVGRDPYEYPVFQAGPRVCLGKEMAFLQMKRVVAGVLRRFRVVPATEEGFEPVLVTYLTSKMKGGLPVRIVERDARGN